jgi:membrane associated rhomboid family serine protease
MSKEAEYPAREPIFNAPPYIIGLCGVIVVIHAATSLLGQEAAIWMLQRFAYSPLYLWSALGAVDLNIPALRLGTLVTHAFLHADWLHLGVNVGLLLSFGAVVERIFGGVHMLLVFLLSAVAGAVTQTFFEGQAPFVMVGASATVYAMMALVVCIMIVSKQGGMRQRGLIMAVVLMGLNLLTGLIGLGDFLGGAEIAWQAHLGGFVLGLLVFKPLLWLRRRRLSQAAR